jgi:methyl-accepting chemotaxis protein
MDEVSENLSEIVRNIRISAQEVDTASSEIAQGNVDLSSRTESTASALEQTSAALKELSNQVKESASFALDANHIAKDARAVADEGGKVVLETVDVMEKINTQAKKISEIIGVIDSIAFQTNILALNAAVEAARAGDQGRGFAVVAQEVRTLAQRSASAAKEIRELIGASVEQAAIGAEKVRLAGNTMQRVVSAIRNVGNKVDEISRTSQSQADGFLQIEEAVTEMDNHTQQNAALVEEASAATMSLQMQAQKLLQTVEQLKTNDQSEDVLLNTKISAARPSNRITPKKILSIK